MPEILSESYDAVVDAHSAATTAKAFYVRNGMVMMAMNDADASADNVFVVSTPNMRVTKAAGSAWSVGDQVFFDADNSNFTNVYADGLALAGFVREDAASDDVEGKIAFNLQLGAGDKRTPYYATFTNGAEAGNAIVVSVQLKDALGNDLANRASVQAYLSSDANGDVLEPHSATLTVSGGTDGVVIPYAAANAAGHTAFNLVSEADGDIDVSIAQTSGADTMYLVLVMPDGRLVVSDAITFAA